MSRILPEPAQPEPAQPEPAQPEPAQPAIDPLETRRAAACPTLPCRGVLDPRLLRLVCSSRTGPFSQRECEGAGRSSRAGRLFERPRALFERTRTMDAAPAALRVLGPGPFRVIHQPCASATRR